MGSDLHEPFSQVRAGPYSAQGSRVFIRILLTEADTALHDRGNYILLMDHAPVEEGQAARAKSPADIGVSVADIGGLCKTRAAI
jgi:hypothetical protein